MDSFDFNYSIFQMEFKFNNQRGYTSIKFHCKDTNQSNFIFWTSIELYDGIYRNKIIKFDLEFNILNEESQSIMKLRKEFVDTLFEINEFQQSPEYYLWSVNTTLLKRIYGRTTIIIDSNNSCFNGVVELWFDSYYKGSISTHTSIVLSTFVFFSVWLASHFLHEKSENHVCIPSIKGVSSITIIQNLFWNLIFFAEYIRLSVSREEYHLLALAAMWHLYLLFHELYVIHKFFNRYRVNFLRIWENFKILCLLTFIFMFITSWSMLYQPVLTNN